MPKSHSLKPRVLRDLAEIDGADGWWEATSPAAAFRLEPGPAGLPKGWLRLTMMVQAPRNALAVPGFKVRTFALPLGVWPKNRALAKSGSWTDPKTKTVTRYDNQAILEVSGGTTKSPYDPAFNPLSITRIEVIGQQMQHTLEAMDKNGTRYVSDGDPSKVTKPGSAPADK